MKRLTAVLLAVLLLFLVACNNENPSSLPTVTPSSDNISADNPSSEEASSKEEVSSKQSSQKPSSTPSSKPSAPSSSAASSTTSSATSSAKPSSSHSSSVGSSSQSSSVSSKPNQTTPEQNSDSVHTEHYCYSNLTALQKQYYDSMHTAVHEMHSSWVVLGEFTDNYAKDIAVVRHALVADHPDIFWLPSYYITAKGSDDDGNPAALIMFSTSADVSPSYLVKRSEKAAMEEELKKAVQDIASKVTATNPFGIELQLHDLLCAKVEYTTDENDPMIYSAYGALVNGRALCEGYSKAMQLLLHQFNIPCTTVTGVSNGEGHMWNQVKIGAGWYNLDVTWDDTSNDFVSHEYFNLTDAEISIDHTFNKDFYKLTQKEFESGAIAFNLSKPVCQSNNENYFAKRGFVFTKDNISELAGYIISSKDQTIEVKFTSAAFAKEFNKNASSYLERLNTALSKQNPKLTYYIGRYSPSALTLKFYKTAK